MRDDTRDCASVGHIQFSSNVEDIVKFQTHRQDAVLWAKNLRFLTFEHGSAGNQEGVAVDEEIIDVSKKGQCVRCEQRVALPAGHICNSHGGYNNKSAVLEQEQKYKQFSDPCIHVVDKTCEACKHIPLFPTRERATKFRIRRLMPKGTKPSELSHCTHFLAVSYCWQNSERTTDVSESDLYDVIEEDGSVRKVRASKDVIDRSVDFAAQNGFRMIWIDQECINQADGPEKELGIQAMDIVYQRARMSIGLFRTKFEEQRHLDALLLFFETLVGSSFIKRGPHPLRKCRKLKFDVLAEALTMIMNDRWNTRGWILQEAFSASGRMTLLFPAGRETSVKGWSLVCHDLSLTELAIQLDVLQSCIAKSRETIIARNFKPDVPDWDKTMECLRWFHPVAKPSHSFDFWINGSRSKRTCNAAVALSFLRTRYNDRNADRLAIVANLCDYSLRLNTIKLKETEHSLSLCTYILALLNGDFSLLPPEAYNIPRNLKMEQLQTSGDFSWINTSLKPLQYINATIFNPGGPTVGRNTSNIYRISRTGFRLPGFLWKIDTFVDLSGILYKYSEPWQRLRTPYKTHKIRTSGEGTKRSGPPPTTKSHWLATTHILFEIMISLKDSGQIGIADAIWQSVMNPIWMKKQRGDPIESVLDFPENLSLENRQNMFDIEVDKHEGGFYPWWLIDRVMSAGGFWVGTAERSEKYDLDDEEEPQNIQGIDQAEVSGSEANASQTNLFQETEHGLSEDRSAVVNDSSLEAEEAACSDNSKANRTMETSRIDNDSPGAEAYQRRSNMKMKGHATKQLTASVLWKLAQHVMETDDDRNYIFGREGEKDVYLMTPEAMASLVRAISYRHYEPEEASKRQYAIFDIEGNVDGKVLVLTPFNDLLETIPHPDSRSMSTSWIVDIVPDAVPADNSQPIKQTLRAKGMVRGMWNFQSIPENWYNLI